MFPFTPNITNWTEVASGGVGPTGATGATGPAGPSFAGQGFSVEVGADMPITSGFTLVPFDNVNASRGGYTGWFDIPLHTGIIHQTGTYLVTASVDYIHDFNASIENINLTIKRNGAGGTPLVSNTTHYPSSANDIATLVCTNIVDLDLDDTLQCYLQCPLTSDQTIGALSRFSCQRLA